MKRIMTIDDSPRVRQMVAMTLESRSDEVVEASDGAGAIARLADGEFHLFITNLNMPGMDGLKLLTTVSQAEKKKEGKAAGATECIQALPTRRSVAGREESDALKGPA